MSAAELLVVINGTIVSLTVAILAVLKGWCAMRDRKPQRGVEDADL